MKLVADLAKNLIKMSRKYEDDFLELIPDRLLNKELENIDLAYWSDEIFKISIQKEAKIAGLYNIDTANNAGWRNALGVARYADRIDKNTKEQVELEEAGLDFILRLSDFVKNW